MKTTGRTRRWLATVLIVAAAVAAGAGSWLLAREPGPQLPQISAYSRGETVRVGPFVYCNVINLDDCTRADSLSALAVVAEDPVQVSVPSAISRAPWRLITVYEDERNTTIAVFRPDTRLAVTVPTVDPERGRVVGIVVQLMTLVQDQDGAVFDLPHAEWSVPLAWTR